MHSHWSNKDSQAEDSGRIEEKAQIEDLSFATGEDLDSTDKTVN
jgi:hypothetical protein